MSKNHVHLQFSAIDSLKKEAILTFDDELTIWLQRHGLSFGHEAKWTEVTRYQIRDTNITVALTGREFLPLDSNLQSIKAFLSKQNSQQLSPSDVIQKRVPTGYISIQYATEFNVVPFKLSFTFPTVIKRCAIACRNAGIQLPYGNGKEFDDHGVTIEKFEI